MRRVAFFNAVSVLTNFAISTLLLALAADHLVATVTFALAVDVLDVMSFALFGFASDGESSLAQVMCVLLEADVTLALFVEEIPDCSGFKASFYALA